MAAYEYIALDAGGRQKKGVIEADSSRQIRQILRDQGLVPLSVDTASDRSSGTFRAVVGDGGAACPHSTLRCSRARCRRCWLRRYRSKKRCAPLRSRPKRPTSARW